MVSHPSRSKTFWTILAGLGLCLCAASADPPVPPQRPAELPLEDVEPDVQDSIRVILKALPSLEKPGHGLDRILIHLPENPLPEIVWDRRGAAHEQGLKKLAKKLTSLRAGPGQGVLLIEADEDLEADQVIQVVDRCKRASSREVTLAARSKQQAGRLQIALKKAGIRIELTEAPGTDFLKMTDIDTAVLHISTDVDRQAEVSVPGAASPNDAVGILDAPREALPTNLPPPRVFGAKEDQGGAICYCPPVRFAPPLAGSFYGRSGATREMALRDGGGTRDTEAAVTRGLRWLVRMQMADGRWLLNDPRFEDKGIADDIAGTAFGLLPFLGAGKTHKASRDNPYDRPIEKALLFLIKKQDKRTGNLGGGMYCHGLATIALVEAYGLSQDPALRRPAQMAVNFIVNAQHEGGGWRYLPGQAGDTSVTGWQFMALKSAQMAGLDVPDVTMKKVRRYLDECCDNDEGYGYVGIGSSVNMSAVGLLCRMYLQSWGPNHVRMLKGVDNHLKRNPPTAKNMYYTYYATQVMRHFGGEAWKDWNGKMRAALLEAQDKSDGPMDGSFPFIEGQHGAGRLMQTSLCLLTLEVYYRHLPLYYRERVGGEP